MKELLDKYIYNSKLAPTFHTDIAPVLGITATTVITLLRKRKSATHL